MTWAWMLLTGLLVIMVAELKRERDEARRMVMRLWDLDLVPATPQAERALDDVHNYLEVWGFIETSDED